MNTKNTQSMADSLTPQEYARRAAFHALESRLLLEKIANRADNPDLYMSLVLLDEKMAQVWMPCVLLHLIDQEAIECLLYDIFDDIPDPWVVLNEGDWWGVHRRLFA